MGRRRISNQPIRLAAGAFILNAGIEKLSADEQRAAGVHGMAKGSFPFFEKLPPEQFTKGLAVGEIAIGAALVLPLVSDRLAGLALTPFAGGLLWMYAQNESMHQPNSLRPSGQGTALAKDVWLLGIALTLLATGRRRSKATHEA
jgi:uncharacterized membrane protein YphA (DoxX/SURF4 family)